MRIAQWIGLWALLLVCSIVAPGVADADWKIDRAKAVAAKAWNRMFAVADWATSMVKAEAPPKPKTTLPVKLAS